MLRDLESELLLKAVLDRSKRDDVVLAGSDDVSDQRNEVLQKVLLLAVPRDLKQCKARHRAANWARLDSLGCWIYGLIRCRRLIGRGHKARFDRMAEFRSGWQGRT